MKQTNCLSYIVWIISHMRIFNGKGGGGQHGRVETILVYKRKVLGFIWSLPFLRIDSFIHSLLVDPMCDKNTIVVVVNHQFIINNRISILWNIELIVIYLRSSVELVKYQNTQAIFIDNKRQLTKHFLIEICSAWRTQSLIEVNSKCAKSQCIRMIIWMIFEWHFHLGVKLYDRMIKSHIWCKRCSMLDKATDIVLLFWNPEAHNIFASICCI